MPTKIRIGEEITSLEERLIVAFEKKNSWGKNEAIVEIKHAIKEQLLEIMEKMMNNE